MQSDNPYEAPQADLAKTKDAPRPPMSRVMKVAIAISLFMGITGLVLGLIAWAIRLIHWLS